jgi:hypothetical protein
VQHEADRERDHLGEEELHGRRQPTKPTRRVFSLPIST